MKFTNSKGVTYYLNSKEIIFGTGKLKRKNYYFSKAPGNEFKMPTGYKVIECKTGLPVLKRI